MNTQTETWTTRIGNGLPGTGMPRRMVIHTEPPLACGAPALQLSPAAAQGLFQQLGDAHSDGIDTALILTTAVALNPSWQPGDIVLVNDHVNLLGHNPLMDIAVPPRHRFVDPKGLYPNHLRQQAASLLKGHVTIREGIYFAVPGQSDEESLRALGADMAGPGLVQCALLAAMAGISVLGVVFLTSTGSLSPGWFEETTTEFVTKLTGSAT